eukprot:scaffold687344_cov142-Attheya_sp.AAC.1
MVPVQIYIPARRPVEVSVLDPNNIVSKEYMAFCKLAYEYMTSCNLDYGKHVEVCVHSQSRILTLAGFDWVGNVYQFG